MALKVVWTPQAMRGLENVIDYLEKLDCFGISEFGK